MQSALTSAAPPGRRQEAGAAALAKPALLKTYRRFQRDPQNRCHDGFGFDGRRWEEGQGAAGGRARIRSEAEARSDP
jgi:hypothetical protein